MNAENCRLSTNTEKPVQREVGALLLMMHGGSGSGLGSAPRSVFALLGLPSWRQTALGHLP
jgi:hypothetical protein